MYLVKRVNIGKTDQLDALARSCGELYSKAVVFFWRTVRKKGIWLKPKHMMRIFTSGGMHAHTADACVQSFFASLKSWRTRRKEDSNAHPPRRRRWFFRIEYKDTAMKHENGVMRLSNGGGNDPLILSWPWTKPKTIVVRWNGKQYEAIGTYITTTKIMPIGAKVVGIDLGEIHAAAAYDGEATIIMNGRLLRSKRQYQNKLKAELSSKIDVKKRGSKRRKVLIRSKQKQLTKLNNQIKDVEHKLTTGLVSALYENGAQTLVIGDVRDIRQKLNVGKKNNQKLHQWSFGSIRFKLTYKAEMLGMAIVLQDEAYTSRTCPKCQHVRKSRCSGRVFRCTNKSCKYVAHRDGVGACNIRQKYLHCDAVIGPMARPIGMRYRSHMHVARPAFIGREAAGF